MNFPIYLYYELLIRLAEIQDGIGEYLMTTLNGEVCILKTTTGSLTIPVGVLQKQFEDPTSINQAELIVIAQSYQSNV